MYVYEAISLIAASVLLGTAIGLAQVNCILVFCFADMRVMFRKPMILFRFGLGDDVDFAVQFVHRVAVYIRLSMATLLDRACHVIRR